MSSLYSLKTVGVLILSSMLSLVAYLLPRESLNTEKGAATVTFHVVDSYGRPIAYKVESFREADRPSVELAPQFRGLTLTTAVRGKAYEFHLEPLIEKESFPPIKDKITLYDTSNFAFFVAPKIVVLPDGTAPYPVTRVIIDPPPPDSSGPTWATVRSAFLPNVTDLGPETVLVNKDGSFVLHGLHGGRYVVTVGQDDKTLGVALVDIPLLGSEVPLRITLK